MLSLLATLTALGLVPGSSTQETAIAVAAYHVDAERSEIVVEVGRAGLFKVFGHDHRVHVGRFEGLVEWDSRDPSASRFRLEIDASSLSVADDDVSDEERAAIEGDMESKALAVDEHATIVFESTQVEAERVSSAGDYRLEVRGTLTLRGVARELEVPLDARVTGKRFTAKGELELPSDEWGVPQIAAVGGAVKTKEDLGVAFTIVAVQR